MAYYGNHNLAYDFTLFEEQRRAPVAATRGGRQAEEKPVKAEGRQQVNKAPAAKSAPSRKPRIRRMKRRKSNFVRIAAGIVMGLAAVAIIAVIIHGQVQLTELNQEIIDARAELSEKQSIYTQLEMKVDSSISTSAVEKFAQENLNMSKASNSQKEFISLSEGDKAEVVLTEDKNLFERIADAIASLWS